MEPHTDTNIGRHVLLIDGDMVLFKAAAALEKIIEWEPGYYTRHVDLEEAKDAVRSILGGITSRLECDEFMFFLTDSGHTFRHRLYPEYKSNRKAPKPMALKGLREWACSEFKTQVVPGLEADDLIGIAATAPSASGSRGSRIIVSWDKDLMTIPGLHGHPDTGEITEVSPEEARRTLLIQTIMGDTTDGIPGAKGWGRVKSQRAIDEALEVGEDPWEVVYEAYKGDADEADLMYQLVRILDHEAVQEPQIKAILADIRNDYSKRSN